jgi:hypothetical protein
MCKKAEGFQGNRDVARILSSAFFRSPGRVI